MTTKTENCLFLISFFTSQKERKKSLGEQQNKFVKLWGTMPLTSFLSLGFTKVGPKPSFSLPSSVLIFLKKKQITPKNHFQLFLANFGRKSISFWKKKLLKFPENLEIVDFFKFQNLNCGRNRKFSKNPPKPQAAYLSQKSLSFLSKYCDERKKF